METSRKDAVKVAEQTVRLREIVSDLCLSEARFFEICGLAPNFMSQRNRKNNSLSRRTVAIIKAHVPNLNTNWLIDGTGEMSADGEPLKLVEELVPRIVSGNSNSFNENSTINADRPSADISMFMDLLQDYRDEITRLHSIIDILLKK